MTAATHAFTIEQGIPFSKVLTLKDPLGALADLTGCSAAMQLRVAPDTPALHTLTVANGGITLGGAAGTITLHIPASATSKFSFSSAKYDLILVQSDGTKLPILKGTVKLERLITQGVV